MSPRRQALLDRRARLLARSAALRVDIAREARALQAPLAWGDQALQALAWLRRNPAWPAAAAGVLVVVRPRRALRWAASAWGAWRLWRRARPYAVRVAQGWQRGLSQR